MPLFEETLKLRRAKLGSEHVNTLTSMNNLALAYRKAGRLAQAVPLFQETLNLRKSKFGLENADTLSSMNNLGWAFWESGRAAEALALFEETLTLRRAKFGPDHPHTLGAAYNLARLLKDQGKSTEAESLFREVLSHRQVLAEDQRVFTGCLASLGALLTDRGQADKAEPLLRECWEVRRTSLPKSDPVNSEAEILLGGCLTVLGRYSEAEPLFLNSYATLKSVQRADPAKLRRSLECIIRLYESWGKSDLAAEWRAEARQQAQNHGE